MFQKHIHKVKFYPSADDFTQALLVMLVTNIMSDCDHHHHHQHVCRCYPWEGPQANSPFTTCKRRFCHRDVGYWHSHHQIVVVILIIILIIIMVRSDCEGLEPKEADCYRFKSPDYHHPCFLS